MRTNPKVVYVRHRSHSDPRCHAVIVRGVCRRLSHEGSLPFAPQLSLTQSLDERTETDLAWRLCLGLVTLANEVRVYGEPTKSKHLEIGEARRLGIPVVAGDHEGDKALTGDPPR